MSKPVTWVVVADGGRARMFRVGPPGEPLIPVAADMIADHSMSRDLKSDRPGRAFDSVGGGRHAVEPATDPHRKAKRDFAAAIIRRLDEDRLKGAFDRLLLVAPPQLLGDLRAEMGDGLRAVIGAEIAKDLVKTGLPALASEVQDALRPA